MAERGGGAPRGTLGVGTLCLGNFGQDLRGERTVPRFELGDRPPRRPGVPRIEGADSLGDQRLDAVALLQREPVAILLRAARQLAGDQRGDALGRGLDPDLSLRSYERARIADNPSNTTRTPRRIAKAVSSVVQSAGKARVKDCMALIGHSPST